MAILTSLFITLESDSSSNRMFITPDFIRHPLFHVRESSSSRFCFLIMQIVNQHFLFPSLKFEILNINQLTFLPRVILTRLLC